MSSIGSARSKSETSDGARTTTAWITTARRMMTKMTTKTTTMKTTMMTMTTTMTMMVVQKIARTAVLKVSQLLTLVRASTTKARCNSLRSKAMAVVLVRQVAIHKTTAILRV